MFHVRRRPADTQPRRRKKKPLGISNGGGSMTADREGPVLIEITHSGDGGRRLKLTTEPVEVGSANTNALQLFGPSIQPRHCLISLHEGVCTVTPLHADGLTFVNGHHITQPTILHVRTINRLASGKEKKLELMTRDESFISHTHAGDSDSFEHFSFPECLLSLWINKRKSTLLVLIFSASVYTDFLIRVWFFYTRNVFLSLIYRTDPWWCLDAQLHIASSTCQPTDAITWRFRNRNWTRRICMKSEYATLFIIGFDGCYVPFHHKLSRGCLNARVQVGLLVTRVMRFWSNCRLIDQSESIEGNWVAFVNDIIEWKTD